MRAQPCTIKYTQDDNSVVITVCDGTAVHLFISAQELRNLYWKGRGNGGIAIVPPIVPIVPPQPKEPTRR